MCIGDISMAILPKLSQITIERIPDMFRNDFMDSLSMALVHDNRPNFSIKPCDDPTYTDANVVYQEYLHNKLRNIYTGTVGGEDFILSQVDNDPVLYKFIFSTDVFTNMSRAAYSLHYATSIHNLLNNALRYCVFAEVILKGTNISYILKSRHGEKSRLWKYNEMLDNFNFIEAILSVSGEDRRGIHMNRVDLSWSDDIFDRSGLLNETDWLI